MIAPGGSPWAYNSPIFPSTSLPLVLIPLTGLSGAPFTGRRCVEQ